MKPLQILRAILLIGVGATVVGLAVFRDAKSSTVTASAPPRVAVKENGRTNNLAAAGKGDGRTKGTSSLQAFRDRITKAKAEKDREKFMALLSEAVQSLDPSQIKEALAEVEAMKDERFQTRLRNMLLSRWGESDPKAALTYIQGLNLDGGSFPFNVVKYVISSWAEKDFSAAKAWVEGLPPGTYPRRSAMGDLAFALAQKDPAGLWRNFAAAFSRAYDTYPMDLCGPSFFMGDDVQSVLGRRAEIQKAAGAWPRAEIPSIVMVLDDTSVLEEDFTIGYQNLAVIQQRQYGLARCGVPYRLHLFEDLGRENFPACHKVFLFPNLFRLTPERMTILRDKVFRDGNVAIFGPATGITDGVRLRADLVSELLGIPLHLVRQESPRRVTVDRFDHPLTVNLPRRIDYGDSYAYGPLLAPACAAFPTGPAQDPDVRRLGGIQWPSALDGPGLVIREFGRGAAGNGKPGPRDKNDYAVLFSAAVPLPAELLRAIASYSGTHVYSDSDDDLIFADSRTLGIHSMRPGERTFRLPRPTAVWDLVENRKISDKTDTLTFRIEPPQTRMFYLGEMEGGRP